MKKQVFSVPRGWDGHVHIRRGPVMQTVLPYTASDFSGALVMPNTDPKILTGRDAMVYLGDILQVRRGFEASMTIYLTPNTTPGMIETAKTLGVVAGKLYPDGVTTGSDCGITDFEAMTPVFARMQQVGMVLSIHGQMPGKGINPFERERLFLPTLVWIANKFPQLTIVMEHLSTKEAVDTVRHLGPNVAATITAHHLFLTMNDFVDGNLQPHNFCIPPAQTETDRQVLWEAVLSGNPKFYFGSDSAPHPRSAKECAKAKGGIFSAIVARALLMQGFDERDALHMLPGFIADFGPARYGIRPAKLKDLVTMVRQDWVVPLSIPILGTDEVIIPFMAGQILHWQVLNATKQL